MTKSISCQTLMRESDSQTIPAPFEKIKHDNTIQERLINDFSDKDKMYNFLDIKILVENC